MTSPLSDVEIAAESVALVGFIAKVRPSETGCWEWAGGHYPNGYARYSTEGFCLAHRFAYESLIGPIPEGLQIDHRCRNRGCVNPRHLEPVTPEENNRRGMSPSAMNARKVLCKNGHPLVEENVYIRPDGSRTCRECHRAAVRRHRERRRSS